jgi:hypothetical protein
MRTDFVVLSVLQLKTPAGMWRGGRRHAVQQLIPFQGKGIFTFGDPITIKSNCKVNTITKSKDALQGNSVTTKTQTDNICSGATSSWKTSS